jgi:TusA-related sulfurtransferase
MKNVPEWAREAGHNVEIEEVDDGEWEVVIEKAK